METLDKNFHFPEDILLEIMFKLPPKYVFRSKCVCKKWFSLISHPSFYPHYISQYKEPPPFTFIFQGENNRTRCFISNDGTFKNFSSPFPYDQIPGTKVVATCNDLILYRSECQDFTYFVANPFTGKHVELPSHSIRKSHASTGFISFVKNGITSYNIVRLVNESHNKGLSNAQQSLIFETFSSKTGEWRDFKPTNCTSIPKFDSRPCIAFKGVLHWICNKLTTLLAYDPCQSPDQCRFISIPNEVYHMKGMNAILGVSGENLCYFEMSKICIRSSNLAQWKLWVLKDYEKGEWSLDQEGKERKIESLDVLCSVLCFYSPLLPMTFHPWNKEIVYFWYEGYVLTFNIRTGWFEDKSYTLFSDCLVLTWEIFSLFMPLCPTQIPELQWLTN